MGKLVVTRTVRWRLWGAASAVAIVFAAVGIAAAPPFARRGLWRYLLKDRILAPVEIILSTPPENHESTRLPVYDLSIPSSSMTELESDPPASLRQYAPASFTFDGDTHRVKVKVRGDTRHHWAGRNKSWRVRFRKADMFGGRRRLNLIVPKGRSKLEGYLTDWMGRQMGLLAPRGEFIHLRINGQYAGVRYAVEQTDEFFLFDKQRTFGEVYDSDGSRYRAGLDGRGSDFSFFVPEYWTKMIAFTEESGGDMAPLERLCSLVMADSEKNRPGRSLSTRLNIDQYLKFYAYMVVCGSTHHDRLHNVRLHLDPTNGLFEPVAWDIYGYGGDQVYDDFETDVPIDLPLNKLHEMILSDSVLLNRRNRMILEAIDGVASSRAQLAEVDRIIELIGPDMLCDWSKVNSFRGLAGQRPLTNSEWRRNVARLRGWISARHDFIRDYISSTQVAVIPEAGGLTVLVSGANAVDLSELRISGAAGSAVYIDSDVDGLVGASDIPLGRVGASGSGDGVVRPGRRFFPARRRKKNDRLGVKTYNLGYELARDVSARYRLLFAPPADVRITAVLASDSVTGKQLELTPRASMPTVADGWREPTAAVDPGPKTVIRWSKSREVLGVFELGPRQELVIDSGTEIKLHPGASMLLRGRVLAEGTAERPIRFVRQNPAKPWGSVAVEGDGSKGSVFRHCIFRGGKQTRIGAARFLGAVAAYNTKVEFDHCDWIECEGEDSLNTKHSEFKLTDCRFLRNAGDGFDCDLSTGTVLGCLFYFNHDDGLDCGTASPRIVDSLFIGQLDKGLSVGEQSSPRVENCLFWGNDGFGAAVKDRSRPDFIGCSFVRNGKGVSHYRKKEEFGGSFGRFKACLFAGNDVDMDADVLSRFDAVHCQAGSKLAGDGNMTDSDHPVTIPATLAELALRPNVRGLVLPSGASREVLKQLKLDGTEAHIGINRDISFTVPTEVPASIFERAATKDR